MAKINKSLRQFGRGEAVAKRVNGDMVFCLATALPCFAAECR
jgi:hypothetical protein